MHRYDQYTKRTIRDRIALFPFEHAAAVGILASAVGIYRTVGMNPHGAGLGWVLIGSSLVAAVLILTSTHWKGEVFNGLMIGGFGHTAAVAGWLLHAYIVSRTGSSDWFLVLPLSLMVASGLQALLMRRVLDAHKEVLQEAVDGGREA